MAAIDSGGARATSRIDPMLVAALLLSVLPVAIAGVVGMPDLPDHIARYAVLARHAPGDPLAAFYSVAWHWVGNLGVDLPVTLIAPLFGAETAARLVVGAIAPLTVFGLWSIGRAIHGRTTAGTMLAMPFVLAQPYLFGFVNYCLSVALALIVAGCWLRAPADRPLRAIGYAVAALLVWTAHVEGWAVLLVIVGGIELAQVRDARGSVQRALRATPLLAPLVPMLAWRGASAGFPARYANELAWSKVMNLVTTLKGIDKPFDLAMTAAIGATLVAMLACARRPRIDLRLGLGAALLLVASVLLPTTIFESWGADIRLVPVAAMLAALAVRPARSVRAERALLAVAAGLALLRIVVLTIVWAHGATGYERRLALLDRVPRGSRMGYVYTTPSCRTAWALVPDTKLGAYATIRRDAFTNTLFDVAGSNMLVARRAADARWTDGSQWVAPLCPAGTLDRAAIDARIAGMAAAGFDTIWVAGADTIRPAVPAGYAAIVRSGPDLLLARGR